MHSWKKSSSLGFYRRPPFIINGLSDDNVRPGSPMISMGSYIIILVSDQRKSEVSDEKLGVSNENLGFSYERGSPIVLK